MLGLDAVGDALVGGLTDTAALMASTPEADPAPAQAGNAVSDAKRVAALERLVSLANGPAASFLGSGWVRILRTLSALDSLMVRQLLACAACRDAQCNQAASSSPAYLQKAFGTVWLCMAFTRHAVCV